MNKSRLFVFQLKEIIYTLIFIILGIILLIVLFNMFKGKDSPESTKNNTSKSTKVSYVPGVYSTQLELNNQYVTLDVTVDKYSVTSVSLTNLNDSMEVMYPLLQPSIKYIETELARGTSLTDIEYDSDSQYTQTMLIDSIGTLLEKASAK